MDILAVLQPWHWIVFCFLLLVFEALGAGGFLLGAAAAAAAGAQALVSWLLPGLGWPVQISSFGIMTLIFTVGWWVFFRSPGQNSHDPLLNNRAAQLVGRIVVLDSDLPGGHGRIQIGDTKWKVQADKTLSAGTTVVVSAAEGMTLILETYTEV